MFNYKKIVVSTSLIFSSLLHANYTIPKVPTGDDNHYRVHYQSKKGNITFDEDGILSETIKAYSTVPTSREKEPYMYKCDYNLGYNYQSYKINPFKINKEINTYIFPQFTCNISADDLFEVADYNNCHPTVFYLHSIRSGLKTKFSKVGDSWTSYIADNKNTYLNSNPLMIIKNDKTLKVFYKVTNVSNNTYTITWNALNMLNLCTRRCGEIQINSDGVIQSLLINLPNQLNDFCIKNYEQLEQPVTLLIEKITDNTFKNILSKHVNIEFSIML